MNYFGEGLRQAWDLLLAGDPYLWGLTWATVKMALTTTGIALVLGLPLGLLLALGGFRGRGAALTLANAGLGLPPVIVGLTLALLMFPASPLGRFNLLFSMEGVYVAQTVLAFPIVVALTASAVRQVPPGLVDQARALGAGRIRVGLLALREARTGILAAAIAAVGSALSEVGAVVLVGGNIVDKSQTLASAALMQIDGGHFAEGMAIGIILFGLIVVVMGVLTLIQYRDGRDVTVRAVR